MDFRPGATYLTSEVASDLQALGMDIGKRSSSLAQNTFFSSMSVLHSVKHMMI